MKGGGGGGGELAKVQSFTRHNKWKVDAFPEPG